MIPAESVKPIRRGEGTLLSRVEYVRFADLLDSLEPDEWAAPTACAGWDVKAVASHVLGGLECVRLPREFVRQYLAGRKLGFDDPLDGLNELQVREHASMKPAEIAATLRGLIEPALRVRSKTPLLLRQGIRPKLHPAGRVSMGWILDVIYTRDTFIHRLDVARATGREVEVDEVEQRIVADAVREWADRHREPVTLVLTGPAGATYACTGGGREIEVDAVEFTLMTSGRAPAEGLLATPVQV